MHSNIVNMLWVGDALGRIEILSLTSWAASNYTVRLHAYGSIQNVPGFVELHDAAEIVSPETIQKLRHKKSGSFALASDFFRYKLQQQGGGLWSDLDVVCLKPIRIDEQVVFGLEDEHNINGAVLYLKNSLPITRELVDLFSNNLIPPWTRRSRARKLRLKRVFGLRFSPADLPWGTYGPVAITSLARKYGLFEAAKPKDVFYPLHYSVASRLYDPAFALETVITERTCTLHLWNEALKQFKGTSPPAGSPLAALFKEFGI